MQKYVARRLLLMVPTLLILSLIIFGMLRILPGDVATLILGDSEGGRVSESSIQILREKLGLNRPIYIQYLAWLWDTVRGDFGASLFSDLSVGGQIAQRIPLTIEIAISSKLFSLLIGIPIGVICAVKQNSFIDLFLRFWAIFFDAAPTFWLALLIILGGALWFNWVPPLGYHPIWQDPAANFKQLMWPILILTVGGLASIGRMTRSTMLEVMREDYIRTARAKGLREQVVIARHALKNALIPVVTVAGLQFAGLIAGTVILEYIFGIPGMGSYFIQAIQNKDFPVVQGLVVAFAGMFMLINLVVDLLYGWLDPRISYS
ncbi:MAG: ABC transporter permease [Dehalococcoidia bacterium]|nr:ABC transporter permease [Dehalococcoidia bacterium]